jgi:hypothetical protein
MADLALHSRLTAIAARHSDDRTISPGEAEYLLKVLDEEKTAFDLDYDQIVQLFVTGILDKNEARQKLGL